MSNSGSRFMSALVHDCPELLEVLQSLADDSCDLDTRMNELEATLESLIPTHVGQQQSSVQAKYTNIVGRLDSAIRKCHHALAMIEGEPESAFASAFSSATNSAGPSRSPSLPNMVLGPATTHRAFDDFLDRQLPTVGLPFPPLCGALPPKDNTKLPLSSFVCAKAGEEWTLCYIVSYNNDKYMICDAESETGAAWEVDASEVYPLPTSLPNRRTKYAEYPTGTRVLALWPEGADAWTSVFYMADVIKPPSESGDDCYRLKFVEDADKTKSVPPNYIIRAPPAGK